MIPPMSPFLIAAAFGPVAGIFVTVLALFIQGFLGGDAGILYTDFNACYCQSVFLGHQLPVHFYRKVPHVRMGGDNRFVAGQHLLWA